MSIETIATHPVAGALGAEVSGIDLAAPLSNSATEAVRQALWDHKVIFFRNQNLSPEDHLRIASIFGDIRCERDRQCHENRNDNGATLAGIQPHNC